MAGRLFATLVKWRSESFSPNKVVALHAGTRVASDVNSENFVQLAAWSNVMARKQTDRLAATSKSSVRSRRPKSTKSPGSPAAPFQEQDAERRFGTFTGKGEPPRKGSRSAGIVGQNKRKFKND
jgi:hypothetical protein